MALSDFENSVSAEMSLLLVGWIALLWLAQTVIRKKTIGLSMGYLIVVTFNHLGSFAYAVPGYTQDRLGAEEYLVLRGYDEAGTLLGTQATLLGLVCCLLGFIAANAFPHPASSRKPKRVKTESNRQKAMLGLVVLTTLGYATLYLSLSLPSSGAIISAGRNSVAVLLVLGLYISMKKRKQLVKYWLVAAVLVSLYHIATGYAAYGFINGAFFGAFYLQFRDWRPRRLSKEFVSVITGLYVTTTVFLSYYSFRSQLRTDEAGGLLDRLSFVLNQFQSMTLFNPLNFRSLDLLNIRLNQSWWVGRAIEWHALNPDLKLQGAGLGATVFAWVPRAVWPSKPELGGSGFVAEHTGLDLSQQATFLGGNVFESYVHFGYIGIAAGMFLYGFVLRTLDLRANRLLEQANYTHFSVTALAGVAMLQALQDLFFIINTAVSSVVLLLATFLLLRITFKK